MAGDVVALIGELTDRQPVVGCRAMEELVRLSALSSEVYAFWDELLALAEHRSSFVRTRALTLLAANVRWDEAHRLDAALPQLLAHIIDPKPITARQWIQRLPELAQARPDLAPRLLAALNAVDFSAYADSMRPLLERDAAAAKAQFAR